MTIIKILLLLLAITLINSLLKSKTKYNNNLQLNLFNIFNKNNNNNNNNNDNSNAVANKPTNKQVVLEKISNKQNRNYKLEEEIEKSKQLPPKIIDKQINSYNYNKISEFPNLYNGWIESKSDQIFKQVSSSIKSSLDNKEKYLEILFDPVPNLDEVAVGSNWNQLFRKGVAKNLQVPEYVTNRGGPSTLEWSNLYWMNRIAEYLMKSCNKKNVIALSISGEGLNTKTPTPLKLYKNTQLLRLSDQTKPNSELLAGSIPCDFIIVISPCQESHYKYAKQMADKLNVPVIALNSPYSYRYDLGAGSPFVLTYIMKRVPKGWIFRQYPKDFEIIIEGPDYEISKAFTSSKQLSLVEISKVSMKSSTEKYGATGNDRIFENRL